MIRRYIIALLEVLAPWGVVLAFDVPTRTATVPVCQFPNAIGVNGVTHEVFVTCPVGVMTVIDGRTNRTMTVTVESNPSYCPGPYSLLVDSTRNRVFLPNYFCGGVVMLDRTSGEMRGIDVGLGVDGPVMNSVTNKIYVARPGIIPHTGVGFSSISVIDGFSLEAHDIQVGTGPGSIAVDEARNRIFVANTGDFHTPSNVLTVIDGATEATTEVVVGSFPARVAFDSVTNRVAVVNRGALFAPPPGYGSVSVVDGSTLVVRSVPVENDFPTEVAINSNTGKIYVATYSLASVLEIDEETLALVSIPVSAAVQRLAVNAATNTIYATHGRPTTDIRTVTMIDGATHQTVEIDVGAGSSDVEVNSLMDTTWVANANDNTVTVLYGEAAPCFRCPRLLPARPSLP